MAPAGPNPGSCLHLVASDERSVLSACASQCSPGDTVFLLGPGVMILLRGGTRPFEDSGVSVVFSAEDVEARGLSPLAADAPLGDDATLAALVLEHRFCLSWK